jgi:hypothetical protein
MNEEEENRNLNPMELVTRSDAEERSAIKMHAHPPHPTQFSIH